MILSDIIEPAIEEMSQPRGCIDLGPWRKPIQKQMLRWGCDAISGFASAAALFALNGGNVREMLPGGRLRMALDELLKGKP